MQALQSNASKVYTLDLHNVTTDDAGEYVCVAESTTGQVMQSAWLEVLPGKKSETAISGFSQKSKVINIHNNRETCCFIN